MGGHRKNKDIVPVDQEKSGKEKPKDISTIVGELKESVTYRICIAIREYGGRTFVDIRNFFENEEGKLLPTKRGVTVRPESLDRIISLLVDARIKTVGIYDEVPFNDGSEEQGKDGESSL